jgi:hypothetical protein
LFQHLSALMASLSAVEPKAGWSEHAVSFW